MSKPKVMLNPDVYVDRAMRPYGYATKAKLTKQIVRSLRAEYEHAEVKPSIASLARRVGITDKSMSAVLNYQTWRDV